MSTTRSLPKGFRTLQIRDKRWAYRIGKNWAVLLSPEGKKSAVRLSDLTGLDIALIERGRYKKTLDGMVTPAHVRAYLEAHALPART